MTASKHIARAASIALLSASCAAWAQTAKPGADQFIKQAIQGNLAEVKVGELAQQKGTTQEVKDLGATLAKDHQAANQNAIQAAQQMNVTPPDSPSAKEKATYEKLSRLSGQQFDREFIQAEVKDHKHDIALYKHETQRGSGPAATYAQETLPKLQDHLKMAEDAQRSEHLAGAAKSSKTE